MIQDERDMRRWIAGGLIIAILVFLVYAFLPLGKGIIGSFLLFALLRPSYLWLRAKGAGSMTAALAVIFISIIVILVPLGFMITMLVGQADDLLQGAGSLIAMSEGLDQKVPFDLESTLQDFLQEAGTFLKETLLAGIVSATNFVINVVVMYALLYYLLVNGGKVRQLAYEYIPFDDRRAQKFYAELAMFANATILSTGLVAFIQGALLAFAFIMFDIPNPLLWGFIGMIFSFLPLIGIPIIWIPAAVIQFVLGNTFGAVGILIAGLIISSIDNFLRPILGRKIGNMHPLITLLGVIVGVPIFGIIGLFAGPILLGAFISLVKMYREEFV